MNDKKPLKIKFPKFDINIENPYQKEMEHVIDEKLSDASTTRTIKNVSETLSKSLSVTYDVNEKEELKDKTNSFLKIHGIAPENFDPILTISKLTFGNNKTVNDISIDDNANKLDNNMSGICGEAFLPYQKLAGLDYHYQVMVDLYGKVVAKECSANMLNLKLYMNDPTKILLPYCYCIDASKIVTEGRKFGQVHSSPARRISTYISVLGDTVREISFNVAGAIAIGTLFMDVAHLAIYRERITLDDLKNDRKVRKAMSNHFQQFIHTVNHYSRNAVESPFTNVSCFDRDKLRGLIDDDNYGWYFPKKAAVIDDNNLDDSKEAYKEFVLDMIEELQEIYIDIFDEGDPLRGGLQFPFPVTTINLGITVNKDSGTRSLTTSNNRLLNYITKKDISRFNIYCSEGTKVASCCRLISDAEMMEMGSGVNSFGGSQVSLGSHRVVTLNFTRLAYEADSYDDFKESISESTDMMAKILKAHKVLILKLEKLGRQPWITNGWIDMNHMFSTFGCVGYVEAAEILKEKFNHVDFDYMKDFLEFFNKECARSAKEENIIHNIEGIPAEGASPKLAKADNLLFNGKYKIYANQWSSLWEKHSIFAKMKRDGEIQHLLTGGSIVHFTIESTLTATQAKEIIKKAIEFGCAHFALNCVYTECRSCHKVEKGNKTICEHCLSKELNHYSRVIGYFSLVENWNEVRRTEDMPNRTVTTQEQIEKELGK